MTHVRYVVLIVASMLLSHAVAAQEAAGAGTAQLRYTVAFYNVEDLFDMSDDPNTADEDMLPLSDRGWNEERYRAKLRSLARVIADMGGENGFPVLIGVAEVENRAVLEALAAEPAIASAGYAVCHADSPDVRGIDVAFLYRAGLFRLEGFRSVKAECGYPPTRDFAVVEGRIGDDRFCVVAVHWPSRRGGGRSEAQRRACAGQVRRMADSVRRADPSVKVIVMGDMNDGPRDRSVARDLGARRRVGGDTTGFYNPFASKRRAGRGSYRYDGRWNMLDQIVVSPNLVRSGDACGGLCLCRIGDGRALGEVFRRDWMLRRGSPFATYRGSDYEGGVSDHLPVYVVLGRW